jgi:hypothetical protein
MSDRTRDPGDERRTGRFIPPPDEDRSPQDAAARRGTPREPLPEERLPGEPPPPSGTPSRLPGATGPGTEGLTADDRTPDDTPRHPPGPAGVGAPGDRAAEEDTSGPGARPGSRPATGSEGLRPGTEDLASDTGAADPATRGGTQPAPHGSGTGGENGIAGENAMGGDGAMPDDGLGVPLSGEAGAREAHATESSGPDAWPAAPGGTPAPDGGSGRVGDAAPSPSGVGAPLLPHEETDRWEQRMRQLAVGFVDEPRGAVEQADRALEEIVARFGEAVDRRRRTLRRSWEASEDRGPGSETDTEQLRLALRDYRELAGRLLHL